MDGLRAQLDACTTLPALKRLHDRLAGLTFFDPACGCGNFLVIAYREVRRLELDLLRRIRERERSVGQLGLDVTAEAKVLVGQFYGIEIEEFPARIAETAMYLIDHLENLALSAEFGQYYARFPITDTAHIHNANALGLDWSDVLPADECGYLFGNPPFHGMAWMNAEQQEDNRCVFSEASVPVARSGRLDYVACWYAKALDYLRGRGTKAAFVSTNSITQGEQARSLGPALRDAGFQIDFAHRTFKWTSEASGRANVHVVIIGFSHGRTPQRKILFDYPTVNAAEPVVSTPQHINWYLADGPDVFPDKRYAPLLDALPVGTKGSQPTDGGHLIVGPKELAEVEADPLAAKYLRRFMQTSEFLYDQPRWCLWLVDADPRDLAQSAVLRARLAAVQEARLRSATASVRDQADIPALFTQRRQPTMRYFAIPEVSSDARRYLPGGFLEPDVIAGNKLITFAGADLRLFGLLQSAMWMAWVRTICGRMKSDPSVAPGLAYYAFPFPDRSERVDAAIERAAQGVLDVRAAHEGTTLAVLYDPLAMPADLVHAHQALDRAVDAAYGRARYLGDAARLHALFERYTRLTSADMLPGVAPAAPRRRRART